MTAQVATRYSERTSDQCSDRYSRSQREEKRTDHTRRDHTTPHLTTPEVVISPCSGVLFVSGTDSSSSSLTYAGPVNG